MQNRIREYVEKLFSTAPQNRRTYELREEIIANLQAKYADLTQQGYEEDAAFRIAVDGLGDMNQLLNELQEPPMLESAQEQAQRKKSALIISISIALYIISLIFPILADVYMMDDALAMIPMFTLWAVATGMLVYNVMSRPKYKKPDATLVEDFKEWRYEKDTEKAMLRSISSIVWMLAVVLFFCLGFFAGLFYVAWVVFILAAAVNQIIRLVFLQRRGGNR